MPKSSIEKTNDIEEKKVTRTKKATTSKKSDTKVSSKTDSKKVEPKTTVKAKKDTTTKTKKSTTKVADKAVVSEEPKKAKATTKRKTTTKATTNASKKVDAKVSSKTASKKVASKKTETKATSKKAESKTTKKIESKTTSTKKVEPKATVKAKKDTTTKTKKATTKTKKKVEDTLPKVKKEVKKTTTKSKKTTKKVEPNVKDKVKKIVTKAKEKINNLTSTFLDIVEYYDLPYRYNKTVVKVLAQDPNTLFVYWDLNDNDLQYFKEMYGNNFLYITKPVLVVHNITDGYSFEIDINDFANNWYIHVNDTKCRYVVELGRRPNQSDEIFNIQNNEPTQFVKILSSNEIENPNDHVLYYENKQKLHFKNVKTNAITTRIIDNKHKKDFAEIYKYFSFDETSDNNKFDFENPSSNNPTSNVMK